VPKPAAENAGQYTPAQNDNSGRSLGFADVVESHDATQQTGNPQVRPATWAWWLYDNVSKPGYNGWVQSTNTAVAVGEAVANTGILARNVALKTVFEKPSKAPDVHFERIPFCEVPKAVTTADWWAQNLSSGVVGAVPYAVSGKMAGGVLRNGGRSLGLTGLSSKIVASETAASIVGCAVYDFARDPLEGETRVGNAAGGATAAVFLAGGHLADAKSAAFLAKRLGADFVAQPGFQAAHRLGWRAATGGVAFPAQTLVSSEVSGKDWTWHELGAASVHGMALNTALPYVQEGLNKTVSVPVAKLLDWNDRRVRVAAGIFIERHANYGDEITARAGDRIIAGAGSKVQAGKGSIVAAQQGSNVYAEKGSIVEAYKGSKVGARKGSDVQAFAGSDVQAHDGSNVTAHDGSEVTADHGANVTAREGSRIQAYEGSTIDARNGSTVWARGAAHIEAYEGSRIHADYEALVQARDGSIVYAESGSIVTAHAGSTVVTRKRSICERLRGAEVDALAGSTVYAYEDSHVNAHEGSVIHAQKDSNVKAGKGSTVYTHGAAKIDAHPESNVIDYKQAIAPENALKGQIRYAKAGERTIAQAGEIIHAEKGSTVEARPGSNVVAQDGSTVHAHHGSIVESLKGSSTVAYEGSLVIAKDGSSVIAEKRSLVEAYKGSQIKVFDGAKVDAFEGTVINTDFGHIFAHSGAHVTAGKWASVDAYKGSIVTALEGSMVKAHEGAYIEAHAGRITAGAGSKVDAYDNCAVAALDGSAVNCYKGAGVTAEEGSVVDAFAGSGVDAKSGSTVNAREGSAVRAYWLSRVNAYKGSNVEASEKSTVYAYEGSQVTTNSSGSIGKATIHAFNGSHVTANVLSVVFAHEGAVVEANRVSIVEAGAGSKVKACDGSKVYACKGSHVEASQGAIIYGEIGAHIDSPAGVKTPLCHTATIDALQEAMKSTGSNDLSRYQLMEMLPPETYTGVSGYDFVSELRSKTFTDNVVPLNGASPALGLTCTFGENGAAWLAQQAQSGRNALTVTKWLPIKSPEQLEGLAPWLTQHADKPLAELSAVAPKWHQLDASTHNLPYIRFIDARHWLVEPEARPYLDASKAQLPWQRMAANQAWTAINEVRTNAETLPESDRHNAIQGAFTTEYERLLALGRDAVLMKSDDSERLISAYHSALDGPHARTLAAAVNYCLPKANQAEQRFAVLRGLQTETFKKAYDRFGGELLDKPVRELTGSSGATWHAVSSLGLACTFGKQAERWLDLQKGLHEQQLKEAQASNNQQAISQAESALTKSDHDAAFWLPIAPVSKLQGLGNWLLRFGDPENPANQGNGTPLQRDPAELQLVAANWADLDQAERSLGYKDLVNVCRAKIYKNQADVAFARESAYWGVQQRNYGDLERRFLASQGTPSPFPLEPRWTSGSLTGRFLPRSDARGMYLGNHTNCCQHPGGVGQACAYYGQESPNSGFFVVENAENKIVAQSWVWESDNGGVCFDSVEGKALGSRANDVKAIYQAAAKKLAETHHTVTVGSNPGFTTSWQSAGRLQLQQPEDFSGYSQDSKNQWLLAKNPKVAVEAKERPQTWVRGGRSEDLAAAEKIAKAVYPKGWQHVPDDADCGLVLVDKNKGVVGYATIETGNQYISDLVVLPEHRGQSMTLLNSLLAYMKQAGGTWTADCRESTSYALLKHAERKGRVVIESDAVTDKMGDQPMHHVKFKVVR